MSINIKADYQGAFKQADIRGIYPTEIDEEVAYLVARGFVDEYGHKTVLVARDMRLSSPALHQAFCKGVTDAGAEVVDLGLVSTPMLYYAAGSMSLPGVVITASHSPKEYNGLKLVLAGAIPLTEEHGLRAIRRRIEKGVFKTVDKIGKIKTKDVSRGYQKFLLKGIKTKNLENLKVVADVGNGMASVVMPLLAEKLPIKFKTMFAKLDGNFPNRGSDPTIRNHQRHLAKELHAHKYDFGIAFDGDADRIAFLDEKGNSINSAVIGALLADHLLKKNPKAKMVFTVLTSRIYEERIKAAGGKPTIARVGHAFIKETMRKKDALFGCEHSGHFYFKEFFVTDSVVLTLRYVLEVYAEAKLAGKTFSEMMKPYVAYQQTEDVVVLVDNKVKALKTVEQYLRQKNPLQVRIFDGVWVDFGDVWGVVKISVTEHALKIVFESKSKTKAKALQAELIAFVKSIAKD